MYEVIRTSDYLEHHGIKGMHWGIRRYQNPDGTLTPAGMKRYGKKYEIRQNTINKKIKNAEYKEQRSDRDEKEINEIEKKILSGDKKTLNEFYKKYYGYDSPGQLGYKDEKEAVLDEIEDLKAEVRDVRRIANRYRKEAEKIAKTPINKLTHDELDNVRKGANKIALVLNTTGAIALGTIMKKSGMSFKESFKDAAGIGLMFQTGAWAITAMITDAIDKYHDKYLKE